MIVSYARGFIFLKTRKTAGTTVEMALTPACGPDDILTLITLEDELQRLQSGKLAARNYVADPSLESAISQAALAENEAEFQALKRRSNRQGAFRNHMVAADVKARLPEKFWDSAFKFTIERHPYEKAVSRAYWNLRQSKSQGLDELIDEAVARSGKDTEIYSIDGDIVVDEILRQEHLEDDLQHVAKKLGLTLPPTLPRAKGRYRTDRRPAAEILSVRQKRVIYERNASTFERMDYRP